MKRNIYANIKNFGSTPNDEAVSLEIESPLSYCLNWTLDQQLLHGGNSYTYGQYSRPCQAYLSDYCAEGWDGFCELASKNVNTSYPNQLDSSKNVTYGMTAGDILIKNTAVKKYTKKMPDGCIQKFEPFDPTVANSPMISYWESKNDCDSSTCDKNSCVPVCEVDPATIDDDPVMNKILMKPHIAIDLLKNIYSNMKKDGTLDSLKNTKLGKFFDIYFSHTASLY